MSLVWCTDLGDFVCRWRVQTNVFRTVWNVHNVPTLVRYENVGDEVKETGRLVEGEILDDTKLQRLLEGAGAAA